MLRWSLNKHKQMAATAPPGEPEWNRFLLQARIKASLDVRADDNEIANIVVNALMGPLLDGLVHDNRRYQAASGRKRTRPLTH